MAIGVCSVIASPQRVAPAAAASSRWLPHEKRARQLDARVQHLKLEKVAGLVRRELAGGRRRRHGVYLPPLARRASAQLQGGGAVSRRSCFHIHTHTHTAAAEEPKEQPQPGAVWRAAAAAGGSGWGGGGGSTCALPCGAASVVSSGGDDDALRHRTRALEGAAWDSLRRACRSVHAGACKHIGSALCTVHSICSRPPALQPRHRAQAHCALRHAGLAALLGVYGDTGE